MVLRAISAQAIRAVLLANATATTFGRLRSSSRAAQTLPGLLCRANRKTAVAPITRSRRRYPVPCLLIPAWRSLPRLLWDFGVSPARPRFLPTGSEQRRVGHTRGDRARRDLADAWDRRQPAARLVGSMPL